MKSLLIILAACAILLLSACQIIGLTPAPDYAATQASMTRIAEAVSGTQGVIDVKTQQAPTKAPTIERLSFANAPLNGATLNVVLGVWPLTPASSTVPNTKPVCLMQCIEELWVTVDGRGTLLVGLFEFANAEQVTAALRDIRATQAIIGIDEINVPDVVSLPDETWIQDNGSSGSRYTLHTLQGRALIILTIYLPDFNTTENALFLALYAERQVQMLKNSGW